MPSQHPLLEAWTPRSEALQAAQQRLFEDSANITLRPVSCLFNQDEGLIDQVQIAGMETVLFTEASPHVDNPEFGRWFVLWVAKAHGQTLHSKRTTKELTNPAAQESVALVPGEIVILDAQKLHWTTMNPPLPRGVSEEEYDAQAQQRFAAGVVFDCDKRPTRQEAERQLEMMVASCEWSKETTRPTKRSSRYGA